MIKRRLLALAVVSLLLMGTTVQAETVTVKQDGGADFTSIQAAIDSINATDGDPDVIQILDSAVYEEQVVLGGLPPIDQASGDFIGDLVAQNRDPLTLRGPDSGDRPTISPNAGDIINYGVFEDNPGDNFAAALVYFGKNITIENVNVQQPGDGPYGVNGQGVEITFRNVLFNMKPGTGGPGEDYMNLNNSDRVADYYDQTPNDVLFDGCVWDGMMDDGTKYPNTFVYYHGTNGEGVDGVEQKNVTPITFRDCTFMNAGDDLTRLRSYDANQDDVNQSMINCVFKDNEGNSVNFDGGGEKVASRCIFSNNVNGLSADLPQGDNAAIRIRGRSGRTGTVTISNCIFSNNASLDAYADPAGDQWAAVLVNNDGDDGPITIDHCTFDGNGVGVRFADGSARPRTAVISNSIFSNNIGAGITANGLSPSYVGSGAEDALDLTIKNCLFYENQGIDFDLGAADGTVTGDPMYANTDALGNEPFALQEGSPAIDAADDGLMVGTQDVDGSARVEGSSSDIGAQEYGAGPSAVPQYMLYE